MSNVVVLGASQDAERYAFKAIKMLQEQGHTVFAVSRSGKDMQGARGVRSIADIDAPIDTVTVYINPGHFRGVMDELIDANPKRVIMNPGTEDEGHKERMEQEGIRVIEACTLVLLTTGQFEAA